MTTAGGVAGLAGAYNGEGIKFTVFDGGRIYAAHPAFNNIAAGAPAESELTKKQLQTTIVLIQPELQDLLEVSPSM
ncbi:hypothetical protein [Chryseobacterium indoltheticum]|uniref:hypothetical protein n=1 Tax=Chryseobacterium indoltheticum TaxID=254 RepID=UPI003F4959BD